jgi:hypothetical protein
MHDLLNTFQSVVLSLVLESQNCQLQTVYKNLLIVKVCFLYLTILFEALIIEN